MCLQAAYTLPDWLTIVGFPLVLLGIFVGLIQVRASAENSASSRLAAESAKDAAEAAQQAIEKTQRNLADNHLLMLLLQLETLGKELAAAANRFQVHEEESMRRLQEERGLEILDNWILVASQLQMFLDSGEADEVELIKALDASARVAGAAKDRIVEHKPFNDATKELREMTTVIGVGCAKVLGRMRAFVREGPSR